MESPPISTVPGPWVLKGTVYMFFMYHTSKDVLKLEKSFLYSPLEAESAFAEGTLLGGLSGVMIIRYTDSPVGAYDELIMIPGKYEYQRPTKGKNGESISVTRQNIRIPRIYVSTAESCFNGRKSKPYTYLSMQIV